MWKGGNFLKIALKTTLKGELNRFDSYRNLKLQTKNFFFLFREGKTADSRTPYIPPDPEEKKAAEKAAAKAAKAAEAKAAAAAKVEEKPSTPDIPGISFINSLYKQLNRPWFQR